MNAGESFATNFLEQTLKMFRGATKLCLTESEDPEDFAFKARMRYILVEAYVSIVHGLMESSNQPARIVFGQFVDTIFDFIAKSLDN